MRSRIKSSISGAVRQYDKFYSASKKKVESRLIALYRNSGMFGKGGSDLGDDIVKLSDHLYDMHHNLPRFYERNLHTINKNIPLEYRSMANSAIMTLIGESALMRRFADAPSRYFNKEFKKSLTYVSDQLLYGKSNLEDEVIRTSLEHSRQGLRFSLRKLSMSNVMNSEEQRKMLADLHCKSILREVSKIFVLNIDKFAKKYNLKHEDIEQIKSHFPNHDTDLSFEEILAQTKKASMVHDLIVSKVGNIEGMGNNESMILHEIMSIYNDGVLEIKKKHKDFYQDISEVEELINNSGYAKEEIETLYVMSRIAYVVGVISVAYGINVLFSTLQEKLDNSIDVKEEKEDEFSYIRDHANTIFSKQMFKSALGHAFNLYKKYNNKGADGYIVALDTEAHDYPKFVFRIASLFSLMLIHDKINEQDDEVPKTVKEGATDKAKGILFSAEFETKLLKSILRFISGSHVAMRMEIKEKILDPIVDNARQVFVENGRFINIMQKISDEVLKQDEIFNDGSIVFDHQQNLYEPPTTNPRVSETFKKEQSENHSGQTKG